MQDSRTGKIRPCLEGVCVRVCVFVVSRGVVKVLGFRFRLSPRCGGVEVQVDGIVLGLG